MFYKKNFPVEKKKDYLISNKKIFSKELSAKIVESMSTASSSNESFQKEDVEVECDDNRYLSIFLLFALERTTNIKLTLINYSPERKLSLFTSTYFTSRFSPNKILLVLHSKFPPNDLNCIDICTGF
jgi:hypothetical protein